MPLLLPFSEFPANLSEWSSKANKLSWNLATTGNVCYNLTYVCTYFLNKFTVICHWSYWSQLSFIVDTKYLLSKRNHYTGDLIKSYLNIFAFRWISYKIISVEVVYVLYIVCGLAVDVPVLYYEQLKKYKFDLRLFTFKIGELFCVGTRTKI
jgi:hypothetical protein